METQKIANLLGNVDNESSTLKCNNKMASMIKVTKEMKIVQLLNLKPKSLNQIFVIIQTHKFL